MKNRVFARNLLIWVALFCGGSVSAQSVRRKTPSTKSCTVPTEEMQVIVAFAFDSLSHASAVLVNQTQAKLADVDGLNPQLAAQGHGIPPDIREDFKKKNVSSCYIGPFTGVPNVRFMSLSEERQIFGKGINGWREFHKKFGADTSLNSVSRVGFNSDKTVALLYVSSGIAPMGAAGGLCLLERKEGKWVIKWNVVTWST